MSSTTTDPRRGLFLVFEGVEGAGKSTHLRRLSKRLDRLGIAHLVVREPGGTPAGERIREIVLDPAAELHRETELLLLLAARAEFVRGLVAPALERGELVLADRYEMSTLAYQGIARGLGLERTRQLNAFATGGLKPDGTILFTIAPERGATRKRGTRDRLEREAADFHARVARAYERLAEEDPTVIAISSDDSLEIVEERVWETLVDRWPSRFARGG